MALVDVDKLRSQFYQDGFLHIPDVLTDDEVQSYRSLVLQLSERTTSNTLGNRPSPRGPRDPLAIREAVTVSPELLDLADRPEVLLPVCALMGYNIQLTTSEVFVRPPYPLGTARESQSALDWHTDARVVGPTNGCLPWLYTRAGFFLTPVETEDCGGVRLVPGSHRSSGAPAGLYEGGVGQPHGAMLVRLAPGDVLMFDNRLWHAVDSNYSDSPRVTIYFGYCWRWMRPIDHGLHGLGVPTSGPPHRQQLLGEARTRLGYVFPTHEDTPLKDWAANYGLRDLPGSTVSALYDPCYGVGGSR